MKKIFLIIIFLFFVLSLQASSLITLKSQKMSAGELLKNKKTILFFWNTRCPYCQEEIKRLNKSSIIDKYSDIEFFYIDIGESAKTINNYADRIKLSEKIKDKILIDTDGELAQLYGIFGIPTYIFLKDGKIVYRTFYLDEKLLEEAFK